MTKKFRNVASNGVGNAKIQTPRQVNQSDVIKKILFADIPQIIEFDEEAVKPDSNQLSRNLWAEFDNIQDYTGFQKCGQLDHGLKITEDYNDEKHTLCQIYNEMAEAKTPIQVPTSSIKKLIHIKTRGM
jgi:hypothetical protein